MLHVILGDGALGTRELTKTLEGLWEKEGEGSFWFIIQAKDDPTETDLAIVKWLGDNDLYFDVIADGTTLSTTYAGAQNKHIAKSLAPKVLELMQNMPEENEEADILALFSDLGDVEADEDAWLNEAIEVCSAEGFKAYALNDGMLEIEFSDDEAEEEPEVPAPTKPAAKKATAKPVSAVDEGQPLPGMDEYTRESLSEMTLDQVKVIAEARGISYPPRTRITTYINALLGEGEPTPPTAEVEAPEVAPEEPEEALPVNGAVPAMLIVIVNGNVFSKALSNDEAMEVIGL